MSEGDREIDSERCQRQSQRVPGRQGQRIIVIDRKGEEGRKGGMEEGGVSEVGEGRKEKGEEEGLVEEGRSEERRNEEGKITRLTPPPCTPEGRTRCRTLHQTTRREEGRKGGTGEGDG